MIRLTLALYKFILHTVLSVIYLLVFDTRVHAHESDDLPRASGQKSTCGSPAPGEVVVEEPQLSRVANDDVVEALDLEIEALRNYRDQLREQARSPKCDAIKRAKLEKQAATINTRMMKLNEQALKRRY